MASIFLSHTSVDKPFARRLAADLTARGVRIWIDEAELKVGDSLIREIQKAIREMDYLGVVLSPASVKSSWVQRELEMAMNVEIGGKGIRVLPILYQDCEIPGFLIGKVYADMRGEEYGSGLKALLKRLVGENIDQSLLGLSGLQLEILRIMFAKPDINFTLGVLSELLFDRLQYSVEQNDLEPALAGLIRGGYIVVSGRRYIMRTSVARHLRGKLYPSLA